jgi:hypothetical protein
MIVVSHHSSQGGIMQRSIHWLIATVILVALLTPSASFASAKSYQVTGTVTVLTDDTITILKANGEKWEIDRDAKPTIKGDLKVGAKVTIQYTMTASSIEVKPAK